MESTGPGHPQRPIPGTAATADVGIVELIIYLRSRGCRTFASCQGGGGVRPYIAFEAAADLDRFIVAIEEVLARHDAPSSLRARALDTVWLEPDRELRPEWEACWKYEARVVAGRSPGDSTTVTSAVRIPRADLAQITRYVRDAATGGKDRREG
jgi:hypothetical protein